METQEMNVKQMARAAKKRLKSGFWDKREEILSTVKMGESNGISSSKVVEYYEKKLSNEDTQPKTKEELFYDKVKNILQTEGEVSNVIGRLKDDQYYNSLTYDAKQKYVFDLSAKYRQAVERYKKEQILENANKNNQV